MNLFQKLRIKFPSDLVRLEYQKVKKDEASSFFKLTLIILILLCLYAMVLCIIYQKYQAIIFLSSLAVLGLITWVSSRRIGRLMDLMLLFFCSCILLYAYLSIRSSLLQGFYSSVFVYGHIYGFLERIISSTF